MTPANLLLLAAGAASDGTRASGLQVVARRPWCARRGHFAVPKAAARVRGCLPERSAERPGERMVVFSYSQG